MGGAKRVEEGGYPHGCDGIENEVIVRSVARRRDVR